MLPVQVFFFFSSFSFISRVYEVVLWSIENQQHNIINVATVMSPGEFCSLLGVSWNIPRCVKRSPVLSQTHQLRLCHTRTHTRTHKCMHEHRFTSQHILMKWHDVAEFGPRLSLVASPTVPPPPPSLLSFFFLSFFYYIFSSSFSFWLLSCWYISCFWHGSCIAYG